ncbi:MAG: hypothetical protein VKJ24_17910 [Synechococcales bacterium]|nr:hypothetical protein [Synechococcales bacterium]
MVPDSPSKSNFPNPSGSKASASRTRSKSSPLWQDLTSLEVSPQLLRQGGRSLLNRPVGWAIGAMGLLLLLLWDGRLVMATGAGIATMLTIYQLRSQRSQTWRTQLQQWLQIWQQPLMFATGSGVGASFLTYLAISIWLDVDQHWLATGLLLQGFTSLGLLGLFLWQRWERGQQTQQDQFKTTIAALSNPEPLTRLATVQELSQGIVEHQWQTGQLRQIVAAFRLLLDHETEPVIQEAIWEGLQALNLKVTSAASPTGTSLQQLTGDMTPPMVTVARSFQEVGQVPIELETED